MQVAELCRIVSRTYSLVIIFLTYFTLNEYSLESSHQQQSSFLKSQVDEFEEELRIKENSLSEAIFRLEELQKQIAHDDKKFLKSIAMIPSDFQVHENFPIEGRDTTDDVRALVISLLVQWRDQVGFYPRAAKPQISKAEEKFLQHITDLVMESHHRVTAAERRAQALHFQSAQLTSRNKMLDSQIQRLRIELLKSTKKSALFKEFGLLISLEHLKKEGAVNTLLKKQNRQLLSLLESLQQEFVSEKPFTQNSNISVK